LSELAKAEFPDKLRFLFEPKRYKVTYGGRGGAKSWGIARALLILGAQKPLRILCAREIQKSIKDSVHQLLKDQIKALSLTGFYEILNAEIRGQNGTLILFEGLKHNVDNIKSKEGLDIVWVEEAQAVSKNSWDTLIPTIRKEGSEIWISFNPQLETDETYKRFVLNPPASAEVVKINWRDNPWFPKVLDEERRTLQASDPDAYLNVWEGNTRQTIEGAIFAKELRLALEEKRVTRVPYDRSKPVSTFWDLGRRDFTSIWFAQMVGAEFRLLDYYQARGEFIAHFIKVIQERPYTYADHWLPHDGESQTIGAQHSVEGHLRNANMRTRIVPKTTIAHRINAARTIFNRCVFDEEKTQDGMQALRHWRYEVDPETGIYSDKPVHDGFDGADAFTYFAVAMREPMKPREAEPRLVRAGPQQWMD
jgi:phage terminase large subunit